MSKQVGEVDRHIASRLRTARLARGLSQEALATSLGVTFQQVQKYELAVNRISAGRLQAIATVLDVPVHTFFEQAEPRIPARSDLACPHLLAITESWSAVPQRERLAIANLTRTLAAVSG